LFGGGGDLGKGRASRKGLQPETGSDGYRGGAMKPTFVVESVMRWVKEIRKEVSQVVWSNGEKGDTYGGFYHFRQSGHG
jgi:hypothetical protein